MKVDPQINPALIKLGKLIEGIPVCMLINQDTTGALISRPMAPLKMDDHGIIWFFTDLRSSAVKKLQTMNVSFCDIERGSYVSLAGHGEIDMDREHIASMWTPAASPWFPEGPESIDLVLLKFTPETAEYWDAPESQMVRLFAMAASIVSGKPVALGEHENFTDLPH